MKKFLFTILIFICFILQINQTNADSCKISSWPSKWLKNYLQNTKKVLNNISWQLNWWNGWENDFAVKVFNDIFNFNNYNDEIRFSAFHRKFQEIPKEVERDYYKIKSLDSSIKDIISKAWKSNLQNKKAKNVCSWVTNCAFTENDSLWDILRNIAQNQEKIKDAYIKISVWEKDFRKDICKNWILTVQWCFFLVSDDFFDDLENNYSNENNIICSKENWLFKDIREKTENIFSNEKSAKNWIKKWKEAWELVIWINTVNKIEYQEKEKELLRKELSRQWVSWDQQKNILENLEKYNKEWWFSFDNNFLKNSFEQTKKKFKNEFQRIKEEVSADFIENYSKISNWENLQINNLTKVQDNSNNIKNIEKKIREAYNKNLELFAMWENSWDNLRNRLINTHIEISNSIKILEKTCKISVKICNDQDSWNWDCWDCNW